MKKMFLLVLLLLPSICFSQSQSSPVTLTIKTDNDVYEVGEKIGVTVEIKNRSKEKISIYDRYLYRPDYALKEGIVHLVNSKNERVLVGAKYEPPIPLLSEYFILEPGQSKRFDFILNEFLNNGLIPDTYRMAFYYYGADTYGGQVLKKVEYPWTGTAISYGIDIQVVAKGVRTEVNEAWENLLIALSSGDENRIKALSTPRGYEELLFNQRKGQNFKVQGDQWGRFKLKWNFIKETTAMGSYGPEMKQSGFGFEKVNGQWKFDRIYYAI